MNDSDPDIRWKQRFNHFRKALKQLRDASAYIDSAKLEQQAADSPLGDLVRQGLIQSFEYTHELAWNVMKDYARYQGNPDVGGSRDATREALQLQLIANGTVWMEMIKSRNQSSHTYNRATAAAIYEQIRERYIDAFIAFEETMQRKLDNGD